MPDDMNLQGLGGVGGIDPSRGKSTRPTQGTDASRKTENVSEVLVAVQKADLAFKTLMQLRNKLFEAYREINQLRI